MGSLLEQSLTEVAELYRSKKVSPVEVTTEVFKRQQQLEPQLNAFIDVMEEEAKIQARAVEEKFMHGESLSLLAGIPYSVKDLFYQKGKKMTCASAVLKNHRPDFTATVLSKLIRTEAVLIGKNNMLEFAYGNVHPDFGQTNNPWNTQKTSGGSSSGSVAAVASGIGYFSLGTDTGGSIRIPASYCGVIGLKPTRGLVSTYGVFPLSWSLDHAGPIARNAKDAAAVLSVIAGYDPLDAHSITGVTSPFNRENFGLEKGRKKIGVLPAEKLAGIQPEVRRVYDKTLKQVELQGWELIEIGLKDWERTEEIIMDVLLPEAAFIHQKYLGRKNDYAEKTFHLLELGVAHKSLDYLNGLKNLKRFTQSVCQLFKDIDFFLTPTVAFAAPAEDPVIGSEELDEMVFTGPFNISGHPAVSFNMGFTADGLPVGMQLVGPHFKDMEVLEAAYQLEQTQEKKSPPIIS